MAFDRFEDELAEHYYFDPNGDDYEPPFETQWGCCYPDRCLCPHPDHQRWECFTAEDAAARAEEEG